MVTRVKFCVKCGRPITTNTGYCEDCASDRAAGINRCSSCGKTNLLSPLAINKRSKLIYCKNCLNAFVKELRMKGLPDNHIKKILDKDFAPVL